MWISQKKKRYGLIIRTVMDHYNLSVTYEILEINKQNLIINQPDGKSTNQVH